MFAFSHLLLFLLLFTVLTDYYSVCAQKDANTAIEMNRITSNTNTDNNSSQTDITMSDNETAIDDNNTLITSNHSITTPLPVNHSQTKSRFTSIHSHSIHSTTSVNKKSSHTFIIVVIVFIIFSYVCIVIVIEWIAYRKRKTNDNEEAVDDSSGKESDNKDGQQDSTLETEAIEPIRDKTSENNESVVSSEPKTDVSLTESPKQLKPTVNQEDSKQTLKVDDINENK